MYDFMTTENCVSILSLFSFGDYALRWLESKTYKHGAETAPIMIAKFKRLENEAMLAIEGEKEARASLEEAREREKVAK
ncbi:hypothetical protein SO802_011037 [Lithocarpus litseifolius]|uniref:Uncharacterized protein n=1 Tax=Lithocarpus litseifolius TaxID=425828 RepID=A0AAW2DK27_9ROSI